MYTITDAFIRAAYWNKARYPREHVAELQSRLLLEELDNCWLLDSLAAGMSVPN